MKNKIVLLKNGKKIFQLYVKASKKSRLGDSDIMLDAGKNMYFEHVVLGNYFKHYKLPESNINSISWHGYYKIIDDHQLYSPIVHIKSHGTKLDTIGHLGSINYVEPFAFPVCSLYVPGNLMIDSLGITDKNHDKCICLDLPQANSNYRFDFFVLPKGLTFKTFNESPLMLLYKFADLEIFNKPDEGHNIIPDAEIKEFEDIGGNDVFVRRVEEPSNIICTTDSGKQVFSEISDCYSIVINDPNDIYNKLTNKPIIICDENGNMLEPKLLKDVHEEAVDFAPTSKIRIWDNFYGKYK